MHIGLIVHCLASSLTTQDGILPFVKSIEDDLAHVREEAQPWEGFWWGALLLTAPSQL